MIARGVSVVKWLKLISILRLDFRKTMTNLLTQPVGKRVDTESRLLDKQKAKNACIYQTTLPITPAQSSYDHWKQHSKGQDQISIIPVLPNNDRVFVQVRDIRSSIVLGVLLQGHPHKVCIPSPLHHAIGVLGCVCPSVVRSVLAAPPPDRPLHSTGTATCQEYP